ncbi:MAG: tyrosinase family protein [Acidobacteriota bacterium]
MQVEIKINCPDPNNDLHIPYVTWGPAICHIRVLENPGETKLYLRPRNLGMGRIVFTDARRETVYPTTTLTCKDGEWTTFYIAGDFGNASVRDKDIELNVYEDSPESEPLGEPIKTELLMVRVRKDAESLTPEERKRFIRAFAVLNKKDRNEFYKQFTDMHVANTDNEIHKYENFLPWHRLYLLNLERDLQKIDASVSLHYWRWDFPAPTLFSADFAGSMRVVTSGSGFRPSFATNNLWRNWNPPGSKALLRSAHQWEVTHNGGYDVLVDRNAPEAYAIAMGGGDYKGLFFVQGRKRGTDFGLVFSKPHGGGHMSFRGLISDIPTAPQDPVFFMLHSNVDRLWAVWQNYWSRFTPTDAKSYTPQGKSPNRDEGFGAYSQETQWPWNGDNKPPRPCQTPYGEYPTPKKGYKVLPKPTPIPNLEEVIDYKGRLDPHHSVGFDYDNVPFHFNPPNFPSSRTMTDKQLCQQILDKELGTEARLAALAATQFVDDVEDHAGLAEIVSDKEEPAEIRIKVMHLLAPYMGYSLEFVESLLEILGDTSEPAGVRKAAMSQFRLFSLGGPAFQEFRPTVLEGLRRLIQDDDHDIAQEAIDLLAYQKDEFLQRVLRQGLDDPKMALTTPFSAVHYLSLDPHDHLDLFRNIAREFEEEEVRALAIQALTSDTDSRDFLVELFQDKGLSSELREACAHALDSQDPEFFLDRSIEAFKDDGEEDHRLLTVLLSKFTLSEDLGKISGDTDLMNRLRQRASQDVAIQPLAAAEGASQDNAFSSLLDELHALIDELEP